MEGGLSLLKRELICWLEPSKPKPAALAAPATAKTADGLPKVYLICELRDERDIEPIEDYLFAQGLDVCLSAFDGSDADAEALHRENLLTCDAAIVFFGVAPRASVGSFGLCGSQHPIRSSLRDACRSRHESLG